MIDVYIAVLRDEGVTLARVISFLQDEQIYPMWLSKQLISSKNWPKN